MTRTQPILRKESSTGDAAVDGLCSGIVAGTAMGLYLVLIGLLIGQGPAVVLGRFDPAGGASPLTGALAHLAVSGVYGVLFGLAGYVAARWRRLPVWLAGLGYGLVLLFLAEALIMRLPGTGSALRETPLVHLAAGHLLYGLTLGLLMDRQRAA
jgi:hypothetical protein